jgi:signal transduction histidine kinase
MNHPKPRPPDRPTTPDDRRIITEIVELAGGLAHELRNPLSTMTMNLQLLAEDLRESSADPEDVRRRAMLKVAVLQREAGRLQRLFDDFLHVVGACRPTARPCDLRTIVRGLVEFLRPEVVLDGVELSLDLPDHEVIVPVDEDLIRQALLNLLRNAQQAIAGGGRIAVCVSDDAKAAEVSVRDSGVGIEPEAIDRVFRPFFSTKPGGTGLGLSITRRIVQEHGGTLTVESTPGAGACFVIRLPK